MSYNIRLGKLGEDAAVKLLENNGYKIIERNFRSKIGEIDIVAQDHDTLVFVEVKTRWSKEYGYPEEAVTPRKLRLIIRTGEYYKLTYPKAPDLMRIDVVAVDIEDGKVADVRLIKNATG